MTIYSRRKFLKTAAAGAAGLTIVPNSILGKSFGHMAPSDKLNIAGVGVGGMGRRNLANMKTENIVALCDVDWKYAAKTFGDYPKARQFKDWREMFDKMGNTIDAIMVATPDHTHAGVAAHAITSGKHTYVQKPLTHSVYESRLLTRLAKSTRLPPRWVTRATRSTGAGKWQSGSSRASLATSTRLTAGQTAQYGRKGWPNQRGGCSRSCDPRLGFVHRAGRKTALRPGIHAMELARFLGFRYRRPG